MIFPARLKSGAEPKQDDGVSRTGAVLRVGEQCQLLKPVRALIVGQLRNYVLEIGAIGTVTHVSGEAIRPTFYDVKFQLPEPSLSATTSISGAELSMLATPVKRPAVRTELGGIPGDQIQPTLGANPKGHAASQRA